MGLEYGMVQNSIGICSPKLITFALLVMLCLTSRIFPSLMIGLVVRSSEPKTNLSFQLNFKLKLRLSLATEKFV